MRVLFVADEESPFLWDYYTPGRLDGIDLIVSCGDLKSEYLTFLVTMGRARLLYVHGNHDTGYERRPPEGCECIDDKLVKIGGLRILGLGGCPRYNGGPYQYTEHEMRMKILRRLPGIRMAGGVDVIVSHASVRGVGDDSDYAHRGFETFRPLVESLKPRYLVHGHVHLNYGANIPRVEWLGETQVVNAYERYVLDI
jgi:Icc-related predicted phosphoesterase